MTNIIVSTIVPIYKGKQYIEKQIKQIENAAKLIEGGLELIFTNDDPSDPLDVSLKSDDVDIIIIQTDKNRGIQGARVYGLSHARGSLIHFLDQDDEIMPDYYVSQLRAIGDADLVYCRCYGGNREVYNLDRVFETSMLKENILATPPLCSVSHALIRKSSIPSLWKERFLKHNGSDDYYLWLCMYAEKKTFAINQDFLYRHIITGGNFSNDCLKAYESDKEMAEIIIEEYSSVLEEDEKIMIKEAPDKNLRRRYNGQMKGDNVLHLLAALLSARGKGKTLEDYLIDKGISSVSIYGASLFGESVRNLLVGGKVSVLYFIDRNADYITEAIPVVHPQDISAIECKERYGAVDAVLMTLVSDDPHTEEFISNNLSVPVFRMRKIIEEMGEYL